MADPRRPNHPHHDHHDHQFGQTFSQFRPPVPNQGGQNASQFQGPANQAGPPKIQGMTVMAPSPISGQQFSPNSFMNMQGFPRGPVPSQQNFNNGPSVPPPAVGGSINGFVPPSGQPLASQSQGPPAAGFRPQGPPPSVSSGPPQPGNVRPPVSGQFVPPSSFSNVAPPAGARTTVNGTSSTLSLPGIPPLSRFPPHPLSQAGTMSRPQRPPLSSSQSPMQGPPKFTMTGPPPPASASGSGPPSFSASSASGASTPMFGPISPPNELPIPFHGQAQYSHQIGAAMKLTPIPTPGNSEPPSQRSSRGPSPVNEQSYDALEGQFVPGTPVNQPSAPSGAAPFPGPTPTTGTHVSFLPPQGHAVAPPTGQRMPPPPRPGFPGPPSGAVHFSTPPSLSAAPPTQRYPQLPQYTGSMPPPPQTTSGAFGQSGPPTRPPGPPSGPFNQGPLPTAPTHLPQGNYFQPSPPSQGMMGPPPSGPTGPPSGPTGVPSGPFGQPSPGQGYPQPITGQNAVNSMAGDFNKTSINDSSRMINLLQEKKLIPTDGVETAKPSLMHDHKKVNCNPDVFRCTLNAIPQTSALLNKARLPLGILIHPFKDLSQLPVIQSSVIVRCRSCRTYINPFVTFVDQRRWKCNLCFRINELPDEFSFDPVTKTYGDPQRRPEIRSATIEFIAPSEYMLRPPQPAVYLYVLDVSFNAIETGYLRVFAQTLLEDLDRLPGDARTQIGFLCFDSSLYFFNLSEGLSQPQMMVVPDIEDVFLPCPDNLLVNLHECREMVAELLNQLPNLFDNNHETGNALGTALQAAFKLMSTTGGRVTVMQTMLPTVGPGALENREASSQASSLNSSILGPASDFYKKLALDCSAQQVAVDLFMLNGQYADIATISCISKYSAGSVQYYPSFHTVRNPSMVDKFESDLRRYLTRKIGFESVMRIRCTRGVSIHTFHGNFFVRSTDLLSLPNVNPDAGFGMQMSIEDNLTETSNMCFQAALLYTSSKGERRIRVHSLCVPITNQLNEVFAGADQQAIAVLLAKMAVDRTISSSLEDARDAMINACQDMMNAYASQIPSSQRVGALMVPHSLRMVPLFTLSMLKSVAFRLATNIKVDDRVFAHLLAKTLPTSILLQNFYPHLYPVHSLNDEDVIEQNNEKIPKAPLLQLSSANIDRHGVYVMDQVENMYLMVGGSVSDAFCKEVFDVPNFAAIHDGMTDLPDLENATSERLRCFISHRIDSRSGGVSFLVIREDSKMRQRFFQHMVEDRTENSMSYYEFLQFIQQKIKG